MTVLDPTDLSSSAYASAPRLRPGGYDEHLLTSSGGGMVLGGSYAITRANVEPLSTARAACWGRFILPAKPPAPWLADMLRAVEGLSWVVEHGHGQSAAPNVDARRNAVAVLHEINDVAPALQPNGVVSMADEGVLVWLAAFAAGGLPASVECYNSGAIVFALSEGDDDHAWEIDRDALTDEVRGLAARLNVAVAGR